MCQPVACRLSLRAPITAAYDSHPAFFSSSVRRTSEPRSSRTRSQRHSCAASARKARTQQRNARTRARPGRAARRRAVLAGAFVYPEVERSWPLLLQRVIVRPTQRQQLCAPRSGQHTLLPSDPRTHLSRHKRLTYTAWQPQDIGAHRGLALRSSADAL